MLYNPHAIQSIHLRDINMFKKLPYTLVLLFFLLTLAACQPASTPAETVTLKIAVLPIIDTLPLYVAQGLNLFENHGVAVELVPVASAPERVQLMAAGQVDGTINEMLAVMQFNKDGVQVQAVRYALRPTESYGHFFILASGRSGITTPEGLKNVEIGVSQGTVIEYVTERLLQSEGLNADEIKTIPVPKIPDRMSLLASGKLSAGTLPDPLSALAVQSGAVIVMDDSAHPQYGFSIYSFRADVIDANPEAIKGFLAAINEAIARINADPTQYTSILSDNNIVPPPLLGTYKVPPFPAAGVPTEAEWKDALSWAKDKSMLEADVSYADSVNDSLLP
jgi:NitT/TauT family transport system substrate-binding protein